MSFHRLAKRSPIIISRIFSIKNISEVPMWFFKVLWVVEPLSMASGKCEASCNIQKILVGRAKCIRSVICLSFWVQPV